MSPLVRGHHHPALLHRPLLLHHHLLLLRVHVFRVEPSPPGILAQARLGHLWHLTRGNLALSNNNLVDGVLDFTKSLLG